MQSTMLESFRQSFESPSQTTLSCNHSSQSFFVKLLEMLGSLRPCDEYKYVYIPCQAASQVLTLNKTVGET